jgi:tetratricopeptide (TPR) repeat protein
VADVLSKANEAYDAKEFATSSQLYQSVVDSGFKSADLYYNLANAYFKQGKYPNAILNYERALLLNPADEDIQFNLSKSKTYVVDKIDVIPEFFVKTLFKKNIVKFSSNNWAILAFLFFFFSIVCYLVYFISISAGKRKLFFTVATFLFLIFILFGTFSYKVKNYIENSVSAIVMSPTVTVKGAPDNEGLDVFIIHEGTKVNVLRSLAGWYEIKIADGKQGWLKQEEIEKI